MAIFLRQSYNVKPLRWGSPADIEYAIKVNAEKVYDVDPDSIVLAMPLFWGLPCLDYSGKRNDGVNHGAYYKDGELEFDGVDEDTVSLSEINIGTIHSVFGLAKGNVDSTGFLGKHGSDYVFYYESNRIYYLGIHWNYTVLDDTTWHRYVIVRNGTSLFLYMDGVSQGEKIIGSNNDCHITMIGGLDGWYWTGSINEVCIYNTTFTADQIALFHALPYGLYQPVIRPVYLIPMPPYVFTKNLSDTINISDVISSKNIGLNKADTISLSDSIAKTFSFSKADTINISDSIAKTFSFSKADTITLSDSIIKTFGLNKADTITLSDSIAKAFGLNKADTIALSDSITKAFGLSLSDTINMTDSSAFGLIVALLDFIAKNKTFNFIAKPGG